MGPSFSSKKLERGRRGRERERILERSIFATVVEEDYLYGLHYQRNQKSNLERRWEG